MHNISEKTNPLVQSLVALILVFLGLVGCSHDRLQTPAVTPSQQLTPIPKPTDQVQVPQTELEAAVRDPTYDANDLWQRIRDNYQLGDIEHSRIDAAISWFNAKKSVIRKSSKRATPLLYYIVEAVTEKGLPAELSLLPLLESGYRIHARSPYGALGPWQFMPATGRQYGLSRGAYVDQRRDLVMSTNAGLAYLADLHRQFDEDWLLAIAAYNAGPGTVKKALAGKRQTFWQIVEKLPIETQTYVPKLLAAAKIIGTPASYGATLHPIPNEPYFETINVDGPVDFSILDELEDWDGKTFRRLNGALSSSYFGRKETLAIRVPVGQGGKIKTHISAAGPPPKQKSFKYLVRSGDTLGQLAIRFNVPLSDLRRFNGIDRNNIRAGKEILIPHSADTVANSTIDVEAAEHRHIVKPGDSFWTLGRRFGVSARSVAQHNGHAINKTLYPGQLLVIPREKRSDKLSRALSELAYVVERGDSLWSIARRFGVATADLKNWNPLVKGNLLRPGQKLLVQSP